LEIAAKQLAQNERESAWREMAKQVAHEIKNPLTPMKLSLQHLQRIYDPSDPQSKEKIDRVASSIIEQIDALTKIANEFANFAKMPKPNEENLNLVPLLENVILVFSQEVDMEISVQTNEPQVWILADKDLMIRVFNNLIKNAIQSIPPDRNGKIEVILKSVQNKLTIEVRDNGRGIPLAARRKMFVPYFTTKSTGTGLGLAIVKQIVEMHHGSIWYDTVEESGTSFWIELPRVIRINNG
jgi:nitrogen fixation/metabolism regulation signal transduction histidine kinase